MALAAGTKLGPYEILQPELICSQFIFNHVSEGEVTSRMTGIDVVDSAVKIGLGACIAGLSSYLTNKTTLERAKNAGYKKRRRDLLEKVINRSIDFDRTYRNQKALYDVFLQQYFV